MLKPLIRQFFELMSKNQNEKFQSIICKYPILDSIFLNVFKTFLLDFKVLNNFDSQISSGTAIQELANIFDLGLTKIGKCYRFDEADMFCYFENDKEVYVATKGK